MFVKAFGDSSGSRATVFRWHSQFVGYKESIEDTEWSGKPGTTKMNENITCVDHCASCRMIAETTIHRILSDDLKKKQKLCTRFVPHVSTGDQRE